MTSAMKKFQGEGSKPALETPSSGKPAWMSKQDYKKYLDRISRQYDGMPEFRPNGR